MSKDTNHNTSSKSEKDDEMLDEYDFSQATHGNPYRDVNQSAIRI